MTQMNVVDNERNTRNQEGTHRNHPAQAYLARILERLSPIDIPAKEYFEAYLRYKVRSYHKIRTIGSSFTSIVLFLVFYGNLGKREIKEVERSDLEAFIEHEQDRGMHLRRSGVVPTLNSPLNAKYKNFKNCSVNMI